jgi:hypothetical protein
MTARNGSRLSLALEVRRARLTGYAGKLTRAAELIEKHAAGRSIPVSDLVREMPEGPDRDELVSLMPLVASALRRRGQAMP